MAVSLPVSLRGARSLGVVVASIVGSFFVYGAHLACGPTNQLGPLGTARVVPPSPAAAASSVSSASGTVAAPESSAAPATAEACGCASAKTTAAFVVTGDEKIVLDPVDARVSLEVSYARGPQGKKQIVLAGVVRAYRSDVAAERPTTFGIRVVLPESAGATPSSPTSLDAYVTTWGAGSVVAPRAYASVAKSALTYTVTEAAVEIRGSITLKDVPTGRAITLDKLSLKKVGASLLPERTGAFRAP